MINIAKIELESCYGCGVCAAACPKDAITISLSKEGFWIPSIDMELCVDCSICEKVCACLDSKAVAPSGANESPSAYALYHRDSEIRRLSTSGGAGMAIAEVAIKSGYKLVGVRYDNTQNIARHFIAQTLEEYSESMNSKYIPSYTVDALIELSKGDRYVVFGSPCQIDSLRRWVKLKRLEDNYIFVDFFCHGVPSYIYWNAYLKHHIKADETLEKPIFRDKKNGWHNFTLTLHTNRRSISTKLSKSDLFLNFFLNNYSLNRPCYSCKYRDRSSAADLRIGDLWGRKYEHDNLGITGVLSLTAKGQSIIDGGLRDICEISEEEYSVVVAGQMHSTISPPPAREYILSELASGAKISKMSSKFLLKARVKNAIPRGLKNFVKYKLLNR